MRFFLSLYRFKTLTEQLAQDESSNRHTLTLTADQSTSQDTKNALSQPKINTSFKYYFSFFPDKLHII
jgi:hypothetical protein